MTLGPTSHHGSTRRRPRPPLTVVIVTYQSAGVVGQCLGSLDVAMADEPTARVVVVDNASQDATLDVVRSVAPKAEIIARASNDGFAAGVNAGLAASPGCDVLVLNPDVRLDPGAVKCLREALDVPGTGIAVPRLRDADGALHLSLRRRPTALRALGEALLGGSRAGRIAALGETVLAPATYDRPGVVEWATGAAWLIARECAAALAPLDERYFLYSEETEYMLRAGERGFSVRFEPAAEAVHLGGEQTTSPRLWALSATNKVRMQRERAGRLAAVAMWCAVLLNELLRCVTRARARGATHRRAVRELLHLRHWPRKPEQETAAGYICFSAQDWWYHNQAHSDFQLMRSIAARRRVLVVNSIGMRMPMPGRSTHVVRKIARKLRSVAKFVRRPLPDQPEFFVMSPLPLPFYGSPTLRSINAALVRAQVALVSRLLGMRDPVIMVTIPTAWDVVRPMRRTALVFNRSDRHSDFPEADRATIEDLEGRLLEHADHVLYVSHALMEDEVPACGDRAFFLDHGVEVAHFRPRDAAEIPADIATLPRPRIGFFGALDDFVVDFDLLEHVATELPDASLVLIGDSNQDTSRRLAEYPNVHLLGFRPYADIPAYGSAFDVAIMPWLDNQWIRYSNPIKLKEYLALGLPVVSTDFAEVEHYTDRVRVAQSPAEFVRAVANALAERAPSAELRASVAHCSWDSRATDLIRLVEGLWSRADPLDTTDSGAKPGHER